MLARWILSLFLMVLSVSAIQRPDTKTTLRNLTRLPRMELQFSLDFEADRGFIAFRTGKDTEHAVNEAREKFTGGPGDARIWLEIASLRLDANDFAGARREFQRAADGLRKRLDVEPGNSRLRIDLANALHGLGRQAEAESILRESVKLAPNAATNWIALSAFLDAHAWELVTDTMNWRGRRGFTDLCRAAVRREASTESAEKAERLINESIEFAREAVKLDADSALAQHRLGIALASRDCFEAVRRRIAGREISQPTDTMIFSREALPALERAAELESENPIRLATLILWRGFAEAADRRIALSSLAEKPLWDVLPDETRRKIEAGFDKLNSFSDSSSAGAALQALGTLRFILQNDLRGAADDLRSAAAEIPESEQVWETLSLVLLRRHDYFEMAAVAEARTMVRPTVRNRVLLAKAYEKLGNTARALDEVVNAIAVNSNDFAANVALANLLMKLSDDDDISSRVRQSLVNAERAIRSGGTGAQYVDLALAQSIYHGLTDQLDRAREILKAALAYSKDNPEVTAALNAIGY